MFFIFLRKKTPPPEKPKNEVLVSESAGNWSQSTIHITNLPDFGHFVGGNTRTISNTL